MKASIRSMLLASPAVAALVGDRVYSRRVPQSSRYPAITINLDTEPGANHAGRERLDRLNVAIDCWARDEGGAAGSTVAAQVADAVVGALATKREIFAGGLELTFGAASIHEDGLDDETKIYSVAVELSGWARSAR